MKIIKIQKDNLRLSIVLWISLILALTVFTSCGYLFGGKIQTCQKSKPVMDNREIRVWALAGDILLAPLALPIDFYTGGVYKPCNKYQVQVTDKRVLRRAKKGKTHHSQPVK